MKRTGVFYRMMIALTGMMLLAPSAYPQTCTTLCDQNDEITYDYIWTAATTYASDVLEELQYVWDGLNISIEGNLVINTPSIKIEDCKIRMAAGGRIVVDDERYLLIKDSEIWSCDDMWEGIEVQEEASLSLYENRIEDAQFAVHADHAQSIVALKNDFNRNNVGIYIEDRYLPRQGSTAVSVFSIAGNQFRCCSGLNDSYTGQSPTPGGISYAGVICQDMVYVATGSDRFDENEFTELMNGIICDNSIIDVINSSFYDIDYVTGGSPATAPYPTAAQGCGIWVSSSKLFQKGLGSGANDDFTFENCEGNSIVSIYSASSIKSNHLRDYGGIGISVTGLFQGSSVTDNRFSEVANPPYRSTDDIPISFWQSYNMADLVMNNHVIMPNLVEEGIVVNGFPNNKAYLHVMTNTVENAGIGISVNLAGANNTFIDRNTLMNDTAGIMITGPAGDNTKVRSNTITGDYSTNTGIFVTNARTAQYCSNTFDSIQTGLEFHLICNNSYVRQNTFEDNQWGLRLMNTSVIGEQEHMENRWVGSFSEWAALNQNTDPNGLGRSIFIVNDDEQQGGSEEFWPNSNGTSSVSPAEDWFRPAVGNNKEDTCAAPTAHGPESGTSHLESISDFDFFVVRDSFLLVTEDTVLDWNNRYYIYKKLELKPSLKTGKTELISFFDSLKTKNLAKFVEAEIQYEDAYVVADSTQESMEGHAEVIDSFISIIRVYNDSLIGDDSSTTLIQSMNNLLIDTDSIKSLYDELLANSIDGAQLKLDKADSLNDLITPQEFYEENEKLINSCMIHYLRDTFTTFSDSIEKEILEIANGCPNYHGRSVFKARWLLSTLDSLSHFIDYGCDTSGLQALRVPSLDDLQTHTHEIAVYPNPAINSITLRLQGVMFIDRIQVVNPAGQQVLSADIQEEIGHAELNVTQLSPGTYFGRIFVKDGSIRTFRFVIIE